MGGGPDLDALGDQPPQDLAADRAGAPVTRTVPAISELRYAGCRPVSFSLTRHSRPASSVSCERLEDRLARPLA